MIVNPDGSVSVSLTPNVYLSPLAGLHAGWLNNVVNNARVAPIPAPAAPVRTAPASPARTAPAAPATPAAPTAPAQTTPDATMLDDYAGYDLNPDNYYTGMPLNPSVNWWPSLTAALGSIGLGALMRQYLNLRNANSPYPNVPNTPPKPKGATPSNVKGSVSPERMAEIQKAAEIPDYLKNTGVPQRYPVTQMIPDWMKIPPKDYTGVWPRNSVEALRRMVTPPVNIPDVNAPLTSAQIASMQYGPVLSEEANRALFDRVSDAMAERGKIPTSIADAQARWSLLSPEEISEQWRRIGLLDRPAPNVPKTPPTNAGKTFVEPTPNIPKTPPTNAGTSFTKQLKGNIKTAGPLLLAVLLANKLLSPSEANAAQSPAPFTAPAPDAYNFNPDAYTYDIGEPPIVNTPAILPPDRRAFATEEEYLRAYEEYLRAIDKPLEPAWNPFESFGIAGLGAKSLAQYIANFLTDSVFQNILYGANE